jgi:hypothetical protein
MLGIMYAILYVLAGVGGTLIVQRLCKSNRPVQQLNRRRSR